MALNNPILGPTLNSINLEEIKREMGPPPWSRLVVLSDHVAAAVIYQGSGQINDRHCHDYDEWWVVMEGEIDWIIEGREDNPVHTKVGDFVFVPALTFHHIFPTGGKPSIRVGVALPGHGHMHEKPPTRARVIIT
jgi:mannose-6-phosphate isomerase-like protein (cupin superfamily)